MNNEKKKYTYEDWMNDRLPNDTGTLFYKEKIDPKTLQQIIEAKEHAFDIGVKIEEKFLFDSFKDRLNRTENPDDYLRLKIQKLDRIFSEENQDLMEVVHGPKIACKNITGGMYQKLIEREERLPFTWLSVFEEPKNIVDARRIKSEYSFLQKLKELRGNNKNHKENNELSPEIKFRISVFANRKRNENKACCICVLENFEQKRDTFQNFGPKAILDHIKKEDSYQNIDGNIPSEKMQKEWITEYKNENPI